MLALLLGLVLLRLVLAYELCDKVPSCLLQVNGTLPRSSIISTLPNGGVGRTFTTTDCIRGLIGITEPCQCQNETLHDTPGFCYFSGNYSQDSSRDRTHFCANQMGINTFSMWNSSQYLDCICFEPTTGMEMRATFTTPICKAGMAEHIPCSTDGKNDNAALLLKYTGKEEAALVAMDVPREQHFRKCQCGRDQCSEDVFGPSRQYCQSDLQFCTEYPSCDIGKVFNPTDIFQTECQCGWRTCGLGEKCETKDIDGVKKYVCTYNGGSSSGIFLIKTFAQAMSLAFIFSLIAFVCLILIILFWILTCLKVNRAAKLASTNIESQ